MAGFGSPGFAHTAIRIPRTIAAARAALGRQMVREIEDDYRHWRQEDRRHPADESADRCIARLRVAATGRAGFWRSGSEGLPQYAVAGSR